MVLRGVGGEMHGATMPRGVGDGALQIDALILRHRGGVDRADTGQIADQPRHEAGAGAVQSADEDIAMCCHGGPFVLRKSGRLWGRGGKVRYSSRDNGEVEERRNLNDRIW